jgi:membrane associated rhomboid family serine protease
MNATARYALAFLAVALVGALLGALLFRRPSGAIIGAGGAMVLFVFSDPRIQEVLSSTFNMLFSLRTGRRDNRDD